MTDHFDTTHERLCRRVERARTDRDMSVRACEKTRDEYVAKMLRDGDQAEMFGSEAA